MRLLALLRTTPFLMALLFAALFAFGAAAFLAYVRGPKGRAVFKRYGFSPL